LRLALLAMLFAAGCREGGGPTPVPSTIVSAAPPVVSAEVGTVLAPAPSFVVRDANGGTLGGVAVSVSVGEGGGSLRNAPTRTAAGATSVGSWTLGTRAGRNTVIVSVGTLPPFVIEAVATAGPPAAIRVVDGNDQVGLAGDALAGALSVEVADRFGNPVAAQEVRFEALAGGGTVAPSVVTTGADGVAGGVRWQLGVERSLQSVRAALPPLATEFAGRAQSDFHIEVRFPGTPPSVQFQEAFTNAAERIRTAVIGDLPDVPVQGINVANCGGGAGATLTETIDDIIIFASVAPIDGVGRVLARAGPCFVRNVSLQALVGSMQFDEADALTLLTSGRFEAVVLHEMLHIVGIGSLWRLKNLVDSVGTADPRYNGPIANARCLLIGFGAQCERGVPVENTGGSGTAGVHWRESVFDRELMTGFAESTPDMPLSVLTLGSLADYGFVVNERAADPFRFGAAAALLPRQRATAEPPWEELLTPRFEVSPFGFVSPIGASSGAVRARE
jgi:hypothetical protein